MHGDLLAAAHYAAAFDPFSCAGCAALYEPMCCALEPMHCGPLIWTWGWHASQQSDSDFTDDWRCAAVPAACRTAPCPGGVLMWQAVWGLCDQCRLQPHPPGVGRWFPGLQGACVCMGSKQELDSSGCPLVAAVGGQGLCSVACVACVCEQRGCVCV